MKCAICDKSFEPTRDTTYAVKAWITPRRKRQGGANNPRWPEQTGEMMCFECEQRWTHGISEG